MLRTLALFLLALFATSSAAIHSALADVVILVENVQTTPDSDVLVGVFAYTTTPLTPDSINGYNLPLDVAPSGQGIASGITIPSPFFDNANPAFGLSPSFNTSFNAVLAIDGRFDLSGGSNVVLGSAATPTKLFDIRFHVASAVPAATYPVSVVMTSPSQQLQISGATLDSVVNGSITVSAVPESAAMVSVVLGFGAVAMAVGGRRRLFGS